MGLYDRLSDLPLRVGGYRLTPLTRQVSSGFERRTTIVRLFDGETEGLGEDVTYDSGDQARFQEQGPVHELSGSYTLAEFSARLDELDLFPREPQDAAYRHYRRWAFESAAVDLSLQQAGRSLAGVVDLRPRPLRFVVSLRLGRPPSIDPLLRLLERVPGTRFKLDATSEWTPELIDALVATDAVDSVDFKGAYRGTIVDQEPDAQLYRRVAEAFPTAWLEDPALTPKTRAALAGHESRITWDAPIHSVADILALSLEPRMLNIKPSRFGSLERLCAAYDHCTERGIAVYGGGQFELDTGRGQIQYLAALFHPDGPNDVAPGDYNLDPPGPDLAPSPLDPLLDEVGFRWRGTS